MSRLAGLFAVDSLAGGFVVQAWIAYWLGVRYGAPTRVVGVVFATIGLLQTASFLAAPAIANRVGLLLARTCLSQMDVPTRQASVMALVPPAERTAAAAVTNTARYVTRPAGVALAGLLQPLGLGIPFLVAGVVKSAYDLALWRLFRPIPLPADTAAITGGAS